MKNLEQIRAAAALKVAKLATKADVNKLPALIITNGLLSAAAFANERNKMGEATRPDMRSVIQGAACTSPRLAGHRNRPRCHGC